MRATLRMLKDSRIPYVLEMGPEDQRVIAYANEAQLRLLNRSKDGWWDTAQRMRFCVGPSGCITWPRGIAEIKGLVTCSGSMPLRNGWYEFLNDGSGLADYNNCCGGGLYDRGYGPTYEDIIPKTYNGAAPLNDKFLRLYISVAADAGKRVLVQGTDADNAPLRTIVGGTTINGIYMTLAFPFVDSTVVIASITGIQKDVTLGPVRAYELNPDDGTERALAYWEPDETVPWYRKSYVKGLTSSCCGGHLVTAMVKLAYYPAKNDTDWLVLGNLAALKDMVQSIRKKEANLEAESLYMERSAIRELNAELRAHGMEPSAVLSVYSGSAKRRFKEIGRII